MSERDLEARLDAVERALTDGETDLTGLEEVADHAAEIDRLDERIESLESTVADLDAAVQAVRGYAGNVRAVNRDVERRASAALAKAETLETAIEDGTGSDYDDPTDGRRQRRESTGETDADRDPATGTGTDRDPRSGDDPDPRRERDVGSGPGSGSGSAVDSGPARAPGFAAPASADRPASGDRELGRPSKYGRGHARGAGDGSDARSDREFAVGDAGGNHRPGGEQPGRTSQFIERVRDVL